MIDNKTQELPDVHSSQPQSHTRFITFITISLIIVGLLIGYLSVNINKQMRSRVVIPISPTIIPHKTQLLPTIVPTSELFDNYRVLTIPALGFLIHYPSDVIPEVQSNLGPTESGGVILKFEGQTKMNEKMGIPFSDGYIITIYPVYNPLNDLSFEELVNKSVEDAKNYDYIVAYPQKTVFSGLPTYQFTSYRIFNKREVTTHYIVQSKNGNVLEIRKMFLDPTNKGYKKTVEQMLSTFKLLE